MASCYAVLYHMTASLLGKAGTVNRFWFAKVLSQLMNMYFHVAGM